MRYILGIDLGSSSVKVSLLQTDSGVCTASAHHPENEAPIKALQAGWAEQDPHDWWQYFKLALRKAMAAANSKADDIAAIGISYQMHGLVCLDHDLQPLRDAIIWCDSRGVPYGEQAFAQLGEEQCLGHLLNSPGNFTASKLAWVKEHEPALFGRIRYIMLPGDYLALRLTGTPATTVGGLSEMMLWDYREECPASFLLDYFGFQPTMLPPLVPTFGEQGGVSRAAASELGLREGIPVAYRAGDQPNNALSLNILNPGEIASTAGTSGVVYGISDRVDYDPLSRVNTFVHVNHTSATPRLGVMHCINGCGILNAWMRHHVAPELDYPGINRLAATASAGSEGLSILPFGNGAERILQNRDIGASIHHLNFNLHSRAHLLRAAHEGIAFAFMYGIEIMQQLGSDSRSGCPHSLQTDGRTATSGIRQIHAGNANLYLSPIFRDTLAALSGVTIELYDTDGAQGAARAAGLGAGLYRNTAEAFASLHRLQAVTPRRDLEGPCTEAYLRWKSLLNNEQ